MIVVAGEALVDIAINDGTVTATPGGAPFNVARGCARLGAPTTLLAAISTDRLGAMLTSGLVEAGVGTAWITSTSRPTTLALAHVDESGVAAYQFYVAGTSAPSLEPRRLPDGTSAFVTGGLALVLEPIGTALERLVTVAPPDVLVVVDVNARRAAIADIDAARARIERVVARADVVKVSDEDLDLLYPGRPLDEVASLLLARGAGVVLVTAGGGPTVIVGPSGVAVVPVGAVEVVDTIGAGDAFTAGFVVWWRERRLGRRELADLVTVERAVAAAHAVAAVVVTRRGSDPPTRPELGTDWSRAFGERRARSPG